jgi:ethanolamine utilization protein EutP (predicted NTPase)
MKMYYTIDKKSTRIPTLTHTKIKQRSDHWRTKQYYPAIILTSAVAEVKIIAVLSNMGETSDRPLIF